MPKAYLKTSFSFSVQKKSTNLEVEDLEISENLAGEYGGFYASIILLTKGSGAIEDAFSSTNFNLIKSDLVSGIYDISVTSENVTVNCSDAVFKIDVRTNVIDEFLDTENKWCLYGLTCNNRTALEFHGGQLISGCSVFENKYMNPFRKEEESEIYNLISVDVSKKKL